MASSNRLCNATPFPVEWNFHAGQEISLDPDGFVELTDPIMCEQIRPGAPGAEPVRMEMEEYGLFVRDPSLPYEVQVMEALEKCIRVKEEQYKNAHNNLRRMAAASGVYNEEAFQETLEQSGHKHLHGQILQLKDRLAKYKELVDPATMRRAKRQQYDPERTIFVLDPPREFESKIALQVFLAENPSIKEQHDRYLAHLQAQQEIQAAAEAPRTSRPGRKADNE